VLNNNEKGNFLQKAVPYFSSEYDPKERFCSYWHQINEVVSLNPKKVLEIGIGNRFVTKYLHLQAKKINITTIDVAHSLQPDIVGSVLAIPFYDESFDVVACYQLLEHLPYRNFQKALREIFRVSQRHVTLSLPDVTTVYRFNIELPRIRPIKKLISHPFPRSSVHNFDGEHYWLIGKTSYPLKKIINDINEAGYQILKTYRVFEWYYHRFFILRKY